MNIKKDNKSFVRYRKKNMLKIIRNEIISAKTWKVDETIVREKNKNTETGVQIP